MRGRALLLLGIATAPLGGCAEQGEPGKGYTLRGRLLDTETGRPVSRRTVYIHAFNDEVPHQVTLDPADTPEFSLTMPRPAIRLRVYDREHIYALYEATLVATAEVTRNEVRLRPTGWVRLHGKVLWRDGKRWRPPSEGGGEVRKVFLAFRTEAGPLRPASVYPAHDGSYSLRAPRERLRVSVVNTSLDLEAQVIDLRGVAGDEVERDIRLVER